MKFHGFSAAPAQKLLTADYGSALAAVGANPAASIAHRGTVVRYLSDYRAVVRTDKGSEIESSTAPLRVGGNGGRKRPVSLRLKLDRGVLAAANPLEAVRVARQLAGGVAVGQDGLRLIPQGAPVAGSLLGSNIIFFANIGRDADATVSPTLTGVNLSTMLRSRLSPETVSYRVVLPAGATMQSLNGRVAILRYGKVVAGIPGPTARDAQGTNVSVRLRIVGSDLVLSIQHRRLDLAYPVLVDPEIIRSITKTTKRWTYLEEAEHYLHESETSEPVPAGLSSTGPASGSPISITLAPRTIPTIEHDGETIVGRWEWTPPPGLKEVTGVEFFDASDSITGTEPPRLFWR